MPKQLTKTVYSYSELDERAKDKARDWYREAGLDYEWWDSVYEDCKTIFDILGITSEKQIKLSGGGYRNEVAIYFSGFSSQGDGACFEGSYRYNKGAAKAIRTHAPMDKELHRIADELQRIQKSNFYSIRAKIKQSGNYSHSGCTDFEVTDTRSQYGDCTSKVEDEIKQVMRDLMDWIYKQLESEYDALQSDESVAESIEANEYEFEKDGRRARF